MRTPNPAENYFPEIVPVVRLSEKLTNLMRSAEQLEVVLKLPGQIKNRVFIVQRTFRPMMVRKDRGAS